MNQQNPIIFFDGVCNLCNAGVQFIIQYDKSNVFMFASLQSETGQAHLQALQLDAEKYDSFIIYESGSYFFKSTAALRVARKLSAGWPILYVLMVIPPFIRDAIYDLVAKNRYKWFGKKDACMIPTPELKARFLK